MFWLSIFASIFSLLVAKVFPFLQSPTQPLNINISAPLNISSSNTSSPLLSTKLILQCNGLQYGADLNRESCIKAYEKIPHLVGDVSFGPRTQGKWMIFLPWRFYSSDGLCAVNVDSRPGVAISDKATWYTIAQAAYEILQECVKPDGVGGSLRNLGAKSNLIVSMLSYTPHVHCTPSRKGHLPPNDTLCEEIGESMPANTEMQIFGPRGEKGIDVGLPRSLNVMSLRGSCELVVGTRGPLDTVNWYDIWAGTRAVSTMCVKKGLGGISTGQGTLGNVFAILKTGSQEAATL